MPIVRGPTRQLILILTVSAILAIVFVTSFRSGSSLPNSHPNIYPNEPFAASLPQDNLDPISSEVLSGHVIAPKLGNETVKAELGRASWKLFHTVMARFPDSPTADESSALRSYIHLFQRLYPCGECAEHFRQILDEFPPQVSSRSAAAAWACHVHNKVNESLDKEAFDCANIGDFYDCGCADEEKEGMNEHGKAVGTKLEMSEEEKMRITGVNGRDIDPLKLKVRPKVKVVK